MRHMKEKPRTQDVLLPCDQLDFGYRAGGVVCGRCYGVCAMPRLDFIFSSLLARWLLFDSSSSILSSADRNYWVKRQAGNDFRLKQASLIS